MRAYAFPRCSISISLPSASLKNTSTVFELVKNGEPVGELIAQVRAMAEQARNAGLNIDYFPTNFAVHCGVLYYIDYECNAYCDEWNFDNWGVKYWSCTPEFEAYLASLRE